MTTTVDYLALAGGIANRLCDEAIRSQGRATWLGDEKESFDGSWEVVCKTVDGDLYGGTAGIGLFLARMAAATKDPRYRTTALEALAHATEWTRRTRSLGTLYGGAAGVAAELAEAGRLLDEPGLTDEAFRVAGESIDHPPQGANDLISGRAGSIVALLHLARTLPFDAALEAARELGEQIVKAAVGTPFPGAAWPSDIGPNEPPLCGLSHGASGIAWALEELALITGEQRYSQVAASAAAYERAWYQREEGNWPDLREFTRAKLARGEAPGFPMFWCHGAVGIGLVRLRQFELTGETVYAVEAEAAMMSAEKQIAEVFEAPRVDLSLCHGVAGFAELFLEGARVFAQPLLREKALSCVDLAARCGQDGAGPWPCGIPDGGENPSLMVGLAGIGMMFLRAADSSVPSVGLPYTLPIMIPRLIVQLKVTESPADLQARAAEVAALLPGSRIERISRRGRVLIRLPAGASAESAARSLSGRQGVEYAEPDAVDHQTGE